jgi:hypothetical protein
MLSGAVEVAFFHPQGRQRNRRSHGSGQVIQALGSGPCTERSPNARDRYWRGRRIIANRVRQDHCMSLGVREIEAAAQRMAKLVV